MSAHKSKSGPSVSLAGVTKTYGGARALNDVSIDVVAGAFVALVGGSGSGKSTLIRTINRLVIPDAGRIEIDGADVRGGPAHLQRRRIGHVIQNTGLFPHMNVAANIAIGLRIAGNHGIETRVDELLDLVDLPRDFAYRAPATLSGGQAQRVGIARALATTPGLMLLDEPFGALDPVTRDALGRAYRALHERLGLTSILVTHDMAEALLMADRVIVLKDGCIAADCSPAELLRGGGGEAAQALVAVPQGQMERLELIRHPGGGRGPDNPSAGTDQSSKERIGPGPRRGDA